MSTIKTYVPELEQLAVDMELQVSVIKEVSAKMAKLPGGDPIVVEHKLYQAAYLEAIKELRKAIAFVKKDCREFDIDDEQEIKEYFALRAGLEKEAV